MDKPARLLLGSGQGQLNPQKHKFITKQASHTETALGCILIPFMNSATSFEPRRQLPPRRSSLLDRPGLGFELNEPVVWKHVAPDRRFRV